MGPCGHYLGATMHLILAVKYNWIKYYLLGRHEYTNYNYMGIISAHVSKQLVFQPSAKIVSTQYLHPIKLCIKVKLLMLTCVANMG